jgi:hypothetical protein
MRRPRLGLEQLTLLLGDVLAVPDHVKLRDGT